MSRKGKIAVGCLVAVLFFGLGFGPLLSPLLYTLTPLQRYYLPTYIASSWHQNEPEAHTEIRWILKLEPRKSDSKGKRERGSKADSKLELAFATERDVLAKSATAMMWAGDALPFSLSADAAREGWTGLEWSYPQQVESAKLASMMRDDYFDGKAWESFFVRPTLSLASLFLLFLMARAGVQGWRERRLWGRPLHRRELLWRWMFEPPARQIAGAGETRAAHAGSAARIASDSPIGCGIADGDSVRVRDADKTAEGRPERSSCSSGCP